MQFNATVNKSHAFREQITPDPSSAWPGLLCPFAQDNAGDAGVGGRRAGGEATASRGGTAATQRLLPLWREYDINDFHECSLDFLETSDFHQFSSK
eukprot:4733047-Prymnesium_polylepis.1